MTPKFNTLSLDSVRKVTGSTLSLRRNRHKKITWHSAELCLRAFLPFDEYRQVINSIVEYCLSPDGEIMYEYVDFATRLAIITSYALIELPEDFDELYFIVYESDLYQTVCSHVNKDQVSAILSAVKSSLGVESWCTNE